MEKTVIFLLRLMLIPLELAFFFVFILFIYILFSINVQPPIVPDVTLPKRIKVAENHYQMGDNYLKKNEYGIWEMYIEGEPYERGLIYGELAKELNQTQEEIFVAQINQFVPPGIFQNFLKILIGYFTSEIPKHISLENQQEIYGISKTFSDKFDYIAPKYTRILGYHAAHDMGHALNDYSVIGCTSFALNGEKTSTGNLMIGRNFDFYVGDDFAKNKLLLFVNPTSGYKFVSYSWAGFTGVVSGMNEHGLTVTINAAKSDLPKGSKTPISLLAREILQYAQNIGEAIAIAKKRKTFVSETLMIGSMSDNSTVLIEKSPSKLGVYKMEGNQLICSNHYQSVSFANDSSNIFNIINSDSKYRYDRVKELINKQENKFTPIDVATILRDQKAQNNDTLGMGNPRAINQLLAHHSVVMMPFERLFYVTTHDFQLGKFIAYDLQKSFALKKAVVGDSLVADKFLYSKEYEQFKKFKNIVNQINQFLLHDINFSLTQDKIDHFISINQESYVTYELLGRYFQKKGDCEKAIFYFKKALSKRTASKQVDKELENRIKECA